jgi:iron(III) transport system permease protein
MSGLSLDIGKNRVQEPARRRPALPMVALAVLFSLMALLPLGFIIAIGIETGWERLRRWCSARVLLSCSATRCG